MKDAAGTYSIRATISVLTMSKCQASDWATTEEAAKAAPSAVRKIVELTMIDGTRSKIDVCDRKGK